MSYNLQQKTPLLSCSSQHSSKSGNNTIVDSLRDIAQQQVNVPMLKSPFKPNQQYDRTHSARCKTSRQSFTLNSPQSDAIQTPKIGETKVLNANLDYFKSEQTQMREHEYVSFYDQGLSQLPIEIIRRKYELIEINLSHNKFHSVPIELMQISKLKLLNISNNLLTTIPNYITQLSCLESLDLSFNNIKQIPLMMCKMNLKEIRLCYNQIEIIPSEFFRLKLNKLGLKYNAFSDIHYDFIEVLKNLQVLELDWFNYTNTGLGQVIIFDQLPHLKDRLMKLANYSQVKKQNITLHGITQVASDLPLSILKVDKKGQSLLFRFIQNESLGLIKYTCQIAPELCIQSDCDGVQPLIFCYTFQKFRSLGVLLHYFNDGSQSLSSLLIVAVIKLDYQTVQQILNKGVDINYRNQVEISGIQFGLTSKTKIPIGSTAMHAVMSCFGRNINQQNISGKIASLLMQSGAFSNIKNSENWTPLHQAIRLPSLAAVRWAVNYNLENHDQANLFDFQIRGGDQKQSSLHLASNLGLVTILLLLQQMQANPFAENIFCRTPKYVCISSLQLIKLSRKYEILRLKQMMLQTNNEDQRNEHKNRNIQALSPFIDQARVNKLQFMNEDNSIIRFDCEQLNQLQSRQTNARDESESIGDEFGADYQEKVTHNLIPLSNPILHRNLRLNLSKIVINVDVGTTSGIPNSNDDPITSKTQKDINGIYRQVSKILRASNQVTQILQELLLVNNIGQSPQQHSMRSEFQSQRSNGFNLQFLLSQKLILPIIMNLVLLKSHREVKYNSYIISASIMLINQMKFRPALKLPLYSLQAQENMIKYTGPFLSLSKQAHSLRHLSPYELEEDYMIKQRQGMSLNLNFDLRNSWNSDADKLAMDFYIDMMMALTLIKVDQMKLQKDNSQIFPRDKINRTTILQYENLQLHDLMQRKYQVNNLSLLINTDRVQSTFTISPNSYKIQGQMSSRRSSSGQNQSPFVSNKFIITKASTQRGDIPQTHSVGQNNSSIHAMEPLTSENKIKICFRPIAPPTISISPHNFQSQISASGSTLSKNTLKSPKKIFFNVTSFNHQQQLRSLQQSGQVSLVKGERSGSQQSGISYIPHENISESDNSQKEINVSPYNVSLKKYLV